MTDRPYQYGGARALVEMHDASMRDFLGWWRRADREEVELPATSDPNYASREVLLAHVLGCSARYLIWICEQLGTPATDLESRPDPEGLAARADAYLNLVLEVWSRSLRDLTEEQAYTPAYESTWGSPYCIDAMLEHAVMHPIRHAHQLSSLVKRRREEQRRASSH